MRADDPMHLVFITAVVPTAAPSSGADVANAAIVAALRQEGIRVSMLGYAWPGRAHEVEADAVVLGTIDLRTATAGRVQKARWLLRAVTSNLTFASAKVRVAPPAMVRKSIVALGRVDGYVISAVQMAGAYPEVFADKPQIFVAHNVEHQSAEENTRSAAGRHERALFHREAKLLREVETKQCARARFVFTLTEEDRTTLCLDPARSAVLPLVFGRERAAGARSPRYDAALLGTWTWQSNRTGLEWFLGKVVPHLRPDVRIMIGGIAPRDLRCSHPGVEFVGRVPDATAFLSRARVVPLVSRAGTGVQLKTIEAFELGLPTVATSRSLRGIDEVPANCRVTDHPIEFARALEHAIDTRIGIVDGSAFRHRRQAKLAAAIRVGLGALQPSERGRQLPRGGLPAPGASDT